MPRRKTGSIRIRGGKVYARVRYVDSFGKYPQIERRAKYKTHAEQIIKSFTKSTARKSNTFFAFLSGATFDKLAKHYKQYYLIPPQYFEGHKVAGLRDPQKYFGRLNTLVRHFGKMPFEFITHTDVQQFKLARIQTPTHRKKTPRSIASVNRELALLRRIFEIARIDGLVKRNPCVGTTPLISVAAEVKRQRILTREEERRLLEQCTGQRHHLALIITGALDTGMRRGEIFKLKWENVDLEERMINIPRIITKTCNERQVGITERLHAGLLLLRARTDVFKECLVLGIRDNCSNSYRSARSKAGLTDVRFHDLRHTAATRMVQGGLSIAEVARILGHAQISTAYRYVNADSTTITRSMEILNKFNREE